MYIIYSRYGDLTIKCTSDIYDIYFQSSTMTFVGVGEISDWFKNTEEVESIFCHLDLGEMALGRHTINSGEWTIQIINNNL